MAYVFSPPDSNLGDRVRIIYLHIPAAWISYLAFGALTMHTESKSVLIPILRFPIILSVLLPVVIGTEKTLTGANFHNIVPELALVGSHFLIILVLSLFLIEYLFET